MVRSMTGFGRAQGTFGRYVITAEIKSVNHRYLDFTAKLPHAYSFLEEKLKSYVSGEISRGKVECSLQIEDTADNSAEVKVNAPVAEGYVNAVRELAQNYGLPGEMSAYQLAQLPDVLAVSKADVDEEAVTEGTLSALKEAVVGFIKMREAEGEKLKSDVFARTEVILEDVAFIEERSPETVREYNQKLIDRMKELLGDTSVDEARLLNEAAIFADKIAVAEETVRLRSHISQLHTLLSSNEAVGRKLDFLVQEMNREANTIGSKAQDVEIARRVINMKAEIEKIREQIQNIE